MFVKMTLYKFGIVMYNYFCEDFTIINGGQNVSAYIN